MKPSLIKQIKERWDKKRVQERKSIQVIKPTKVDQVAVKL